MFQNVPLRRDKTAFVLTKLSWLPILDRYCSIDVHPMIFCPTIEVREKIAVPVFFSQRLFQAVSVNFQ